MLYMFTALFVKEINKNIVSIRGKRVIITELCCPLLYHLPAPAILGSVFKYQIGKSENYLSEGTRLNPLLKNIKRFLHKSYFLPSRKILHSDYALVSRLF